MSRSKIISAYWVGGERQPLRKVAQTLGVSHNTARNWLIRFDLYNSRCPGRVGNPTRNKKRIDNA